MLSESIVAEQYVVFCEIGGHTVGPVEHRHLYKHDFFAVPHVQLIAGFDNAEVPILMILALKRLDRISRAIDRSVRNMFHQCRKRPAVVDLSVVGDYIVYLVEIDLFAEIFDKFLCERHPYRIDQHGFFLFHQVRIICRSFVRRIIVPVELQELPVDFTDPRNVIF